MQASIAWALRDSAKASISTCTFGVTVAQFTKILPSAPFSNESPLVAKIWRIAASSANDGNDDVGELRHSRERRRRLRADLRRDLPRRFGPRVVCGDDVVPDVLEAPRDVRAHASGTDDTDVAIVAHSKIPRW